MDLRIHSTGKKDAVGRILTFFYCYNHCTVRTVMHGCPLKSSPVLPRVPPVTQYARADFLLLTEKRLETQRRDIRIKSELCTRPSVGVTNAPYILALHIRRDYSQNVQQIRNGQETSARDKPDGGNRLGILHRALVPHPEGTITSASVHMSPKVPQIYLPANFPNSREGISPP